MRPLLIVLLLSALWSTACASRSSASRGSSQPSMVSSARPEWRLPVGQSTGIALDLRITVQIDSTGEPRVETLDVTGLGAAENRSAVAAWLQTARFRPARDAGRPVEGIFRTQVQVRSAVRRVGRLP